MNGWDLLLCAVTCALGGLAFLGLAAVEIDLSERVITSFEEQERKAYKKRLEAAQAQEPPQAEVAA